MREDLAYVKRIDAVSLPKPKPYKYAGPLKEVTPVSTEAANRVYRRLAEGALSDADSVALLEQLSEHERAMVYDWFADSLVEGHTETPIHNVLWEQDFLYKPVGIDQFVEDPYYLGETLAELYPVWRRDLREMFATGSTVNELCLTGAIGIGKTSVAAAALCYKLYWLSCLRDPASHYGLLPGSKIVFGIYSITLRQVSDTAYPKAVSYIDHSPYFKEQFPRDHGIDSKIKFKKKAIEVVVGSQSVHAMGLDLYGVIVDEANFMKVKQDAATKAQIGQAYQLYTDTARRIESRFMQEGGSNPGLMVLSSSRRSQGSFLEQRIAKIAASAGRTLRGLRGLVGKHMYLSDYALWDVKKYPGKRFRVLIGDITRRTEILGDDETAPEGTDVVEVPTQFRAAFEMDAEAAVRDIAGRATLSLHPLIRDRTSIQDAVTPGLKHPFTMETVTISDTDDTTIESFYRRDVALHHPGRWRPKINPDAPRFLHIDLSLTGDSGGIAMAHASGIVKHRTQQPSGEFTFVSKPSVIVDFMLQIIPPRGSETDLSKIIAFVLYLKQFYNIVLVSLDGYQSRHMQQLFRKQKIESLTLSIDRNDDAYVSLRAMFFDRYISTYHYAVFEKEIVHLERDLDHHKVDHPEKFPDGTTGSKDTSDAVAGAVWWCLNDDRAFKSAALLDAQDPQAALAHAPTSTGLDPTTLPPNLSAQTRRVQSPVAVAVPVVKAPNGLSFDWNRLRENMKK